MLREGGSAAKVIISYPMLTYCWDRTLVKQCLEEAATCEQLSQTNMLEKLVLDYCRVHALAGLTKEATSQDAPREGKHDNKVAKR